MNEAAAPVPSAPCAFPARVVTTPPGVIFLMVLLASATITLPLESTAMLRGLLNIAAVPVPSAKPLTLPAKVVTTPSGVIFLMRWFAVSATNTLPLESTPTPRGKKNVAAIPVPSAEPIELPARVVTTPSGVTFLMRLFPLSATYKLPLESRVISEEALNAAAVPIPSINPL